MEPLLNMKEMCDYLKVHRDTIYMLAETDPTFPVKKIGGQWRCKRQSLEAWVDNQTGQVEHRNVVNMPRRGRPCLSRTSPQAKAR